MNSIINAAPMSYNRGIQDVSFKPLAPQALDLPTHLPKFYTYTQKGKADKAYLVVGDSRTSIFGADSFDPLQKWFNHATAFSNAANAAANSQMQKRIVPADAPPPAAMRLYLDLLPTMVQDYQRNSDGSYALDDTLTPVPTINKVAGYLGKWVLEPIEQDPELPGGFGQATIKPGDQVDAITSAQSQKYPWQDLQVSSQGSWGNDQGISMWAPTILSSTPVDQRLITDQMVYPFFISVKARPDALSSPKVVSTLGGAQNVPFVLKPGVIDRNTGSQMYLGDVFVPAYEDVSTPGFSPTFGTFDNIHVYDNEIATVLGLLYAAEFPLADSFSDLNGDDGEEYRINAISAVSSAGVPYHSYQIITGVSNSVRLTETSTLYATGGGDGTMSDALFAGPVEDELLQYADANNPLMDSVNNPETIFWDSGFPLVTKKAMASVIAIRKDICVAAAVFEAGGPVLTDDQERSVAITLLTHFQLYPESDFYATPAARAIIVGSNGFLLNSLYRQRVPANFELLVKAAGYMGAGNGKWIPGKAFDVSPRNQVDNMRDLSLNFRPANARYKDWDAGLIWPESYSMTRSYFPALQTIYPDDTSVLNNFITMLACVWLERLGNANHRDFTGRSDLTEDQMADRIDKAIVAKVTDVFDNRFTIVPVTTYTADDKLRGYSWTTIIKLYGPMMQTVQTLTIQTNRIEDLQP